jgi:pimeloyl-ACP methyl ester carboxylesterase
MAGTLSPPIFRAGSEVLAGRLAAGRLAIIEGAGHGAHHSHAERFVAEVSAFLAG